MTIYKHVVSTYLAGNEIDNCDGCEIDKPDYGAPYVPLLITCEDTIRVILGTHDQRDLRLPDLLIERQALGWLVAIHVNGSGDPTMCLYFLDDGKCYFTIEGAAAAEKGKG